MKELTDTASITTFRQRFEAGRSFDLDDDMEFCPALLTTDDVCATTQMSSVSEDHQTNTLFAGSIV